MFEDDVTDEEVERVREEQRERQAFIEENGFPEGVNFDDLVFRYASIRESHCQLGDRKAPPSVMEMSLERVAQARGWAIRYLQKHPDEWPSCSAMYSGVKIIAEHFLTGGVPILEDMSEEKARTAGMSVLSKTACYAEFIDFSPDDEDAWYDLLMSAVTNAKGIIESS